MLPPWPGWDGLHPLIIHFPIGLLMVAPLFVLLALLLPRRANTFSWSALVLLALGTTAVYVAISTGEAAGELADRTDRITAAIGRHEALAEWTKTVFTVLTLAYAALLLLPLRIRRLARPAVARVGNGAALVLLLGASLLLVNTAHQGGLLVHQLGVHAIVPGAPAADTIPSSAAHPDEH